MAFLKITDPSKRDLIVSEFLKTRNNIQQNFLSEKLGDIGLQRELTKIYKPVTDSQASQSVALREGLRDLKESTSTALQALPSQLHAIQFPHYRSIQAAETDDDDDAAPKERSLIGPIAAQYLTSMASKVSTDKTFGLHAKTGDFYIGDSNVTIAGDDIIIGSDTYYGTEGLWELITSKKPKDYNSEDLDKYRNILLKTNAIINQETGKVKASSGEKYKSIIKPIYEKYLKPSSEHKRGKAPTTGEGISLMPTDPNVLIDMLNIRYASFKAGNTGVRNEIVDISDELLRQQIINKEAYKKLILHI